MILKKGAMFGLDARIALAIFGALSVISGAALYSAISESKLVKLRTSQSEWIKAVEAYMLDTGKDMANFTAKPYRNDANELISPANQIAGWQGPYLPYIVYSHNSTNTVLLVPEFDNKELFFYRYGTGPSAGPAHMGDLCSADKVCYNWVIIGNPDASKAFTQSFVASFDKKYDDGVTTTGDIRSYYNSSTGHANIGIKGPIILAK